MTGRVDSGFYPQGFDWSHGNSLTYSPARHSYWLTLGGADLALELDADSGDLLHVVGEVGLVPSPDDATIVDSGYGPHAATWTPDDSLLIFHNRSGSEHPSRVLEFELDDEAGVAERTWSYSADEDWQARYLGAATRLEDGSTLTNWGSVGVLVLVDPQGETRWSLDLGGAVGSTQVIRDLYTGI